VSRAWKTPGARIMASHTTRKKGGGLKCKCERDSIGSRCRLGEMEETLPS